MSCSPWGSYVAGAPSLCPGLWGLLPALRAPEASLRQGRPEREGGQGWSTLRALLPLRLALRSVRPPRPPRHSLHLLGLDPPAAWCLPGRGATWAKAGGQRRRPGNQPASRAGACAEQPEAEALEGEKGRVPPTCRVLPEGSCCVCVGPGDRAATYSGQARASVYPLTTPLLSAVRGAAPPRDLPPAGVPLPSALCLSACRSLAPRQATWCRLPRRELGA